MRPAVSVFFMTYNHAPYVRQALLSVAMQKTSFSFEIVIGDDFSTDGARAIILETIVPFQDKVKLLFHEKNTGGHPNQEAILRACTGKYIAIIEGDDYWTDEYKLQKQYDAFEQNSDANIVFHDVQMLYQGKFLPGSPTIPKALDGSETLFTRADLARHNFIPTVSVMYRRPSELHFPQWFYSSKIGDYYLHFIYGLNGKIIRIPENMAVYRSHGKGSWTGKSFETNAQNFLFLLNHMSDDSEPELKRHFAYHKVSVLWNTALRFFHSGDPLKYKEFISYMKTYLTELHPNDLINFNILTLESIATGRKIDLYFKTISQMNRLKAVLKKVGRK